MFQKIPHKERLRQIKYRREHEDELGELRIRKLMKELEEAKRGIQSCEEYSSDKEREFTEELKRLGLLGG